MPRNFHDEATLSTQFVSATDMTAPNTQNCQRSKVWRSTDGTDQYVRGTFADSLARSASFFGFFRHRCHGGTVQLQLYSDAAWTTQVYDSGALAVINVVPTDGADWGINPYGSGSIDPFLLDAPYWLYFTPTACLSYQISFAANVSTYGAAYWQVCRFFLGKYFEAAVNPDYGATLGFVDQTEVNRSRGGSRRTNVGVSWRVMQMDLNSIHEDERAAWLDIARQCGTGRDLVLSLFPEDGTRLERDNIVNAEFSALNAIGRQVSRLTSHLQIEEV
ncbi:MAG: hypothetical protein ACRENK_15570 [Gemmatimonadaceae bacterium]